MILNGRITTLLATAVMASTGAIISSLPATATEPVVSSPEVEGISIEAEDLADNFVQGDDPQLDPLSEDAVADYLSENSSTVFEDTDLEVASIRTEDAIATVVQPTEGVSVESVDISESPNGDIVAAASYAAEEVEEDDGVVADDVSASRTGWPDWEVSFRGTVRINVYWKLPEYIAETTGVDYRRVGWAEFQTVRRQYQNDRDSRKDTWQMGRSALAAPDDGWRVRRLWASQDIKEDDRPYALAWVHNLTSPKADFENCKTTGTINAGPFSYAVDNCEDFDVWLGKPGHHRMSYDQGAYIGGGSREFAYMSGFDMKNGVFPHTTYYEFVTFHSNAYAASGTSVKCTSTVRGAEDGTTVRGCRFASGGATIKPAHETQ